MSLAGGLALAIGALLVGGIGGVAIGVALRHARVPSDDDPGGTGPDTAGLAGRVIHSSHNGIVVLNRSGDVVVHNPRAAQLGLVNGPRPDERAWKAAERVLATGEIVKVDLSPLEQGPQAGRRPSAVLGEVRPLGAGFTVVDASDSSDAVRLEATRRDFVANVSHELKTPVGAVALLAEAVLDAVDDPAEVRRFATKILTESTRLGSLVTELIALSRLEGAERLPELAVVEVDELVADALARSRLAAESAGIEITVDEPSGLQVEGDAMLLVTALANLVDNAVAYSPPGSPVSVSRRLVGGRVEIAVTDRGIGIAPEHQRRVFERFFRVDPARSRATGGTGLGLAIVKHVAANHGGDVRLWSASAPGRRSPCGSRATPTRSARTPPAGGAESAGQPGAVEVGGVL